MGNNEEGKSSKSDKSSSPAPPDQANIHVYPDWAAMQAYYGPRMPMPPYYNSAVASGHPPPYMWGPPQPMMPPYGAPYAVYSHGGVYAHPAVSLAAAPVAVETPTKSSGNTDQGLMKKLKSFDSLAMSIGNGTAENKEGAAEHRMSESAETDASTDGSDGNTTGTDQSRRKRSREETSIMGGDGKTEAKPDAAASDKILNTPAAKSVGPILPHGMTTALELTNPATVNAKCSSTGVPQPCAVLPSEAWAQNERELKRERRKQSNRESARRSRLRKQAETEELARKVEALTAENVALKSEMSQLTEKSEKLKLENGTLVERLRSVGVTEEVIPNHTDDKRIAPVSTENLLSRVRNSGSVDENIDEEGDMYDKDSKSGTKLRQLLDTSPRADAVAAG